MPASPARRAGSATGLAVLLQKSAGTQAAIAPAISSPMIRSRAMAAHSMTNTSATAVYPGPENRRRANEPSCWIDMSIAAWPSTAPARPRSDCPRADRTSRSRRKKRNSRSTKAIINGPPTN